MSTPGVYIRCAAEDRNAAAIILSALKNHGIPCASTPNGEAGLAVTTRKMLRRRQACSKKAQASLRTPKDRCVMLMHPNTSAASEKKLYGVRWLAS